MVLDLNLSPDHPWQWFVTWFEPQFPILRSGSSIYFKAWGHCSLAYSTSSKRKAIGLLFFPQLTKADHVPSALVTCSAVSLQFAFNHIMSPPCGKSTMAAHHTANTIWFSTEHTRLCMPQTSPCPLVSLFPHSVPRTFLFPKLSTCIKSQGLCTCSLLTGYYLPFVLS